MSLEVLLLCSLIFVFIVSFCGLLQKIKQSYDRERIIAERIARQQPTLRDGHSDAHMNSTFVEDFDSIHFDRDDGIFPGAPPRYGPVEPPPKYEDIFKAEANITRDLPTAPPQTIRTPARSHTNTRTTQAPPPYTIST